MLVSFFEKFPYEGSELSAIKMMLCKLRKVKEKLEADKDEDTHYHDLDALHTMIEAYFAEKGIRHN
jgi:hypothetical protein